MCQKAELDLLFQVVTNITKEYNAFEYFMIKNTDFPIIKLLDDNTSNEIKKAKLKFSGYSLSEMQQYQQKLSSIGFDNVKYLAGDKPATVNICICRQPL